MTKLLSVFATALLASAGMASANGFSLNAVQDSDESVEFASVFAGAAGVVEVYDFHTAEQGRLLGSEAVHAGANPDVRVSLGVTSADNLLAVLKVNGQVVDQQVLRLEDDKG